MALFVIFAPSGAGKTSLLGELVKELQGLYLSISYTTRDMRPGEQQGVDYVFVSRQEFEAMLQRQAFIEHAQVYGNYYGTSKERLRQQLADGDVLLEIDWQGAKQVKADMQQAVLIAILPPGIDEVRQRLIKRGKDSMEVIDRRMASIGEEIAQAKMADYLVINKNFMRALDDLRAIVRARHLEYHAMQPYHLGLLKQLAKSTYHGDKDA